jgi:hypothetical protein
MQALSIGLIACLATCPSASGHDREPYDFRTSDQYAALSGADRDKLETVNRDLVLLWGALDMYADDQQTTLFCARSYTSCDGHAFQAFQSSRVFEIGSQPVFLHTLTLSTTQLNNETVVFGTTSELMAFAPWSRAKKSVVCWRVTWGNWFTAPPGDGDSSSSGFRRAAPTALAVRVPRYSHWNLVRGRTPSRRSAFSKHRSHPA